MFAREADRYGGSIITEDAYSYNARDIKYIDQYNGMTIERDEDGKWALYYRDHGKQRNLKVKEIKEMLYYGGWIAERMR